MKSLPLLVRRGRRQVIPFISSAPVEFDARVMSYWVCFFPALILAIGPPVELFLDKGNDILSKYFGLSCTGRRIAQISRLGSPFTASQSNLSASVSYASGLKPLGG